MLGRTATLVEDNSSVDNGYATERDATMALPGGFGGRMGSLPGVPAVPSVSLVNGGLRQARDLPVGRAAAMPTAALDNARTVADAGKGVTGLTGGSGISGVLPVHPDLLPNV